MKKLIVLVVFVLAVASVSSCRSNKSSCDYGHIEMQNESIDQDLVACEEQE